jgi:hypothetical protein
MRFRDLTFALVAPVAVLALLFWAGWLETTVPLADVLLPIGAGVFAFTVLSALAGLDRRTGGGR